VLLVVRQPAVKSRSIRQRSAFGPRSLRFKWAGDPGLNQKRLKAFPPISTDIAAPRPSISRSLGHPASFLFTQSHRKPIPFKRLRTSSVSPRVSAPLATLPSRVFPFFPQLSFGGPPGDSSNSIPFTCLFRELAGSPGLARSPSSIPLRPLATCRDLSALPSLARSLLHCFFLRPSPLQSPRSTQKLTSVRRIDER
jgi:hypothetical protein